MLQVSDVSIEGTQTELLDPDFAVAEIFPEGFTLGVIFETEPPIEGLVLQPGNDVALASYTLQSMVILDKGETLEASVDFVDFAEISIFANEPFYHQSLIYRDNSHLNEVGSRILGSAASPTLKTLLRRHQQ